MILVINGLPLCLDKSGILICDLFVNNIISDSLKMLGIMVDTKELSRLRMMRLKILPITLDPCFIKII